MKNFKTVSFSMDDYKCDKCGEIAHFIAIDKDEFEAKYGHLPDGVGPIDLILEHGGEYLCETHYNELLDRK